MTPQPTPEANGQAVVEDGNIVIRIALTSLPMIVEGGWACNAILPRMKITDGVAFAKDWISEMNRESEDGSTPINRMFDVTINEAINQGAEGIEEHERQIA